MPDKVRLCRTGTARGRRHRLSGAGAPRQAAFAIVAPHGGGIEPGTSEIAGRHRRRDALLLCVRWPEGEEERGPAHHEHMLRRTVVSAAADKLRRRRDAARRAERGRRGSLPRRSGRIAGRADWQRLSEQGFDVRVHPNPNLQGHEKGMCAIAARQGPESSSNCRGRFGRRCSNL